METRDCIRVELPVNLFDQTPDPMREILLEGPQYQSDGTLLLDHREFEIAEGSVVQLTSGFAPEGVCLMRNNPFESHQAAFNFCLKGKQTFSLTGNYLPTRADPSECNVLLLPKETFSSSMEANGEFAAATFFIPLSRYFSLLGDAVELLPPNFRTAAEYPNRCYFKNQAWHPGIRQILTQMLGKSFSCSLAGRIFMESKMLELIAVMLELNHRSPASLNFIPRKDEEKIRHARAILERNIADPPTLASLARQIGSNEFALKKGFKAVFGEPVFRFLQKLRMEKAIDLLRTGEWQVNEVAREVGYENLSAFTRAFKLEHSILPSEVRKTPFRHI